jgi:hypothetical protein
MVEPEEKKMSKHEDANLILKLYDLRREAVMREARNWFFSFNPQGIQDFVDVLISEKSGYCRMVLSYWEMAAALVLHGAIDEELFNDCNGEQLFVYSKVEAFLPELRQAFRNPDFLENLEKLVKQMPNADERISSLRERMKDFMALREQRAAKAATADA